MQVDQRILRPILWSLSLASLLAVLKLVTAWLTHSMAVLATGLDSSMDIIASAMNYILLRYAIVPPDEDHEYGHGKAESMAALIQGVLIALSGAYVIGESVHRLIQGTRIDHLASSIYVMIFASVMSTVLVLYLRRKERQHQSLILRSERLHYSMDILTNFAVVVSLSLVWWTELLIWDLVVSLLIGFYILQIAYRLLREGYDELMDRALSEDMRKEIGQIILNFDPHIKGFHKLRTRKVGKKKFVEFHVVIHDVKEFRVAHDKTEALIAKVKEHIPDCDVTVHADYEDDSIKEGL